MNPSSLLLMALAAVAAGAVNALAGGGTLITFPALTAVGVPAVVANVTNTIALCPGYLGGIFAQRSDLRGQDGRVSKLILTVESHSATLTFSGIEDERLLWSDGSLRLD